jgi:peroxiredoxin
MMRKNEMSAEAALANEVLGNHTDSNQMLVDRMNELLASANGTHPLKAGATAPAFRLRDASGKLVSSERLLRSGPLVIVFYRGGWCEYCTSELAEIERALPVFFELGASVLAISPQLLAAGGAQPSFPQRVRDTGNEAANSFGLKYQLTAPLIALCMKLGLDLPRLNGEPSWSLPLSALFVIAGDGKVLYSEVHTDYSKHATARDALLALQSYTQGRKL